MRKLIRRPSPAMAVALIALFVALGGTSVAVISLPKNSVGTKQLRKGGVTSPKLRDRAVRARDIANDTIVGRKLRVATLGPREIAESKLGTVPAATVAFSLNGLTQDKLKLTCPTGTVAASAWCFEEAPRRPASWLAADLACANEGRKLPTLAELVGYYKLTQQVPSGGELTGDTAPMGGQHVATVALNNTGTAVEYIDSAGNAQRAFRCIAGLTNAVP